MKEIGINLTGGGARGAYQAGVLLGLGELLEEQDWLGSKNPIGVWTGTSAGAINACFLAAKANDLREATQELADLWKNISPKQVYNTSVVSLGSNSARWIRDLTFGPIFKKKWADFLLNTSPLLELLEDNIPFEDIQKNLDQNIIRGLNCSSYSYASSQMISFVQAQQEYHWDRIRRTTRNGPITAKHVLASCSIPLLFPPTQLGDSYFGDGGFRNTAPMSPTIKMGAQKILLIGVRYSAPPESIVPIKDKPGVAQIAGSILNALFMDNLDLDLERLVHINEILQECGETVKTKRSEYSFIDTIRIRPSQDLSKIAASRSSDGLPKMITYLLGGLGSGAQTSDLASYILFEPEFCGKLVDLGYKDFHEQKNKILKWISEEA